MAGNNPNSKKALLVASKIKREDARNKIREKLTRAGIVIKNAEHKGILGTLPRSYDRFCKFFEIPKATLDQTHNADLKLLSKEYVAKIRNPPINPVIKKEYEARVKKLETQLSFLGAENHRLSQELADVMGELALERKRMSNLLKQKKKACAFKPV